MRSNAARKPKVNRDTEPGWRYNRQFALKAAQEAGRVLPIFEKEHPEDDRPRLAIEAIKAWGDGIRQLGMIEVRKLALDSHAAAREAKTDAARFAARAAGQAIAVWHVPTHAMAVPLYVCKATHALKRKAKGKRSAAS